MNESQFARTIKDALDAGLGLSPEASARLKVARERALERHRVPAREVALAGAGRAGAVPRGGPSHFLTRILLPAAFLVAAAIGLQQWQEAQHSARQMAQLVAEIEEIDSGLLTGDLPIKAYLDEDFPGMAKAHLGIALALCLGLSVANAQSIKQNPAWEQLTPAQQQILAPIQGEWDKLDAIRKQKWIGITQRYPKMKPEEQARLQKRMQEWATLTPDQRRAAREKYREFEQLPTQERQAIREKWDQYKQELAQKPPAAPAQESTRLPEVPPPKGPAERNKPRRRRRRRRVTEPVAATPQTQQ